MGSSSAEKQFLVSRFASGQVSYHDSKFGIQVRNRNYPISHLTIDKDGIAHGWNVMVQHNSQRKITYSKTLASFADSMIGVMKVHSALIRTMRDPEVFDHN